MRNAIGLGALVLAIGCGGKDPVLDARGTYDVTGRWQIGGPLADGRTPGEMAADLLIEEAVALSSVPGFLEDEAEDALADAIREDVAAVVDAEMPAELQPGAPLRDGLGAVLADLDVESTLVLTDGGPLDGPISGTETVTAIRVTIDGVTHDASLGSFSADWDASGEGLDGLDVDDHDFSFSYLSLVRFAIGAAGGDAVALEAQAAAAVDCAALASQPVTFSAGGQSFTLSTQTLADACAIARDEALDQIFGAFEIAILSAGGPVRAIDDDGDLRADRLESEPGFGGSLAIPGAPDSISPAVVVAFDATRRSQ